RPAASPRARSTRRSRGPRPSGGPSWEVGPLQVSGVLDALLRHAVGGSVRRDAFGVRDSEDLQEGLVDLARLPPALLRRPLVDLAVDVDDTSGVDHVIGGVQDPGLVEPGPVDAGAGELVVGRARYDIAL